MKDYKEQCRAKWKDVEKLMDVIKYEKLNNYQMQKSYEWKLCKKEISISVVMETDGGEKYQGIYYGCKACKKVKIEHIVEDLNIKVVKHDFVKDYLIPHGVLNDSVDDMFLMDDGRTSDDDTYWLFWIRLDERYPAIEALFGSLVLLKALEQQGWTIKNI